MDDIVMASLSMADHGSDIAVIYLWIGDSRIPPIICAFGFLSMFLSSVLPMFLVDKCWISLAMPLGLGMPALILNSHLNPITANSIIQLNHIRHLLGKYLLKVKSGNDGCRYTINTFTETVSNAVIPSQSLTDKLEDATFNIDEFEDDLMFVSKIDEQKLFVEEYISELSELVEKEKKARERAKENVDKERKLLEKENKMQHDEYLRQMGALKMSEDYNREELKGIQKEKNLLHNNFEEDVPHKELYNLLFENDPNGILTEPTIYKRWQKHGTALQNESHQRWTTIKVSLKKELRDCLSLVNNSLLRIYAPKIYKVAESVVESTPQILLQIFVAYKYTRPSWEEGYVLYSSIIISFIANAYVGAMMLFPTSFIQIVYSILLCMADSIFRCCGLLYITITTPFGTSRIVILAMYSLGTMVFLRICFFPREKYNDRSGMTLSNFLVMLVVVFMTSFSAGPSYFILTSGLNLTSENVKYFFQREMVFRVTVTAISLTVGSLETLEYWYMLVGVSSGFVLTLLLAYFMPKVFGANIKSPPSGTFMQVVSPGVYAIGILLLAISILVLHIFQFICVLLWILNYDGGTYNNMGKLMGLFVPGNLYLSVSFLMCLYKLNYDGMISMGYVLIEYTTPVAIVALLNPIYEKYDFLKASSWLAIYFQIVFFSAVILMCAFFGIAIITSRIRERISTILLEYEIRFGIGKPIFNKRL